MKVVGYDEKKEVLSVQGNTHVVWKFSNMDKLKYGAIMSAENPGKYLKELLRKSPTVGTYSEDN